MTKQAALLGTWRMVSWEREFIATGEKLDALGPDPVGYITYGPDGRMHAIVVSRDRAAPSTLPPRDDEKVRLFDSMLAYAGTYTLDSEQVVYHLDISWNQAWTDTDQIRFYRIEGHRLIITGAPGKDPYSGQEIIHRIVFKKVGN
jgi:Lipocalin-like domain